MILKWKNILAQTIINENLVGGKKKKTLATSASHHTLAISIIQSKPGKGSTTHLPRSYQMFLFYLFQGWREMSIFSSVRIKLNKYLLERTE